MKLTAAFTILLLAAGCIDCATIAQGSIKVFNYHGSMPIKNDRTGEIIKTDENNTTQSLGNMPQNQTESEAACWNLIVEQSAVTFALQNRVLDELKRDLDSLELFNLAREKIDATANKMRSNMKDALEALNNGSAEEYFDALFDSSENIVQMSAYIRDPKLEEKAFLALVKAVSRLGRNNSVLIQEFADRCSFVQRSPRPRDIIWA